MSVLNASFLVLLFPIILGMDALGLMDLVALPELRKVDFISTILFEKSFTGIVMLISSGIRK